jgi:hypothetical protein
MRAIVIFLSILCLPAVALADWAEDFDSYAPGSQIVGQGGWEQWSPNAGGLVSNLYSRSPENSLAIAGASDVVHQYSGYTTGKWFYTAWMYIPSTYSGVNPTYFIMLNTYAYPSGPYVWAVQVGFRASDGMVIADCGSTNPVIGPAYVEDDWAEIRVYIDLDEDWTQVYYNGVLLDDPALADHPTLGGGYSWTAGVFGQDTGALNIAAVDLFAYNGTAVYYDDISLTPASPWVDAKVNGGDSNVQILQGSNVKIDYAVVAGTELGNDGDVWVAVMTPFPQPRKFATYDGAGPIQGWNLGLGNPLASGPLGNYAGRALDSPLPLGSWRVYLAIDGVANGVPDLPAVVIDMVDFDVVP